MGGHSHWKGIKEKKGKLDKQRGKLFAKLLRAIEAAARVGDPNPDNNPTLADAIQRAKDASVPRDNIERAVKRAQGAEAGGADYQAVTYEGYGPGGVAVLIEALTDNRNRTSQDLRAVFTKHGGNMGEPGSVQWLFEKRGVILVDKDAAGEDEVLGAALDAGALDVQDVDTQWQVVTEPSAFQPVRDALAAAEVPVASAEITMLPQNTVRVEGAEALKILKMMDAFDDLDDVQSVYANFDIPESVLAEVG